jgi:hypothetical protein
MTFSDQLSKDRLVNEFLHFSHSRAFPSLNASCTRHLTDMLLDSILSRPLKLPNEIETVDWTVSVPDPGWARFARYYELLRGTLVAFPDSPGVTCDHASQIMSRAQAGDPRERTEVALLLGSFFESNSSLRSDFLRLLENRLREVRLGFVVPFAGAPLLAMLARLCDTHFQDRYAELSRIVTGTVVTFVSYRYLSLVVSSITSLFTSFVSRSPGHGPRFMAAAYRALAPSSRAGSSVRLIVGIYCALDQRAAAAGAPHFFRFLADGLRSTNYHIVAGVLAMFDQPEGLRAACDHADIAAPLIYPSLVEVRDGHWYAKLREKAAAVVDVLASADVKFGRAGGDRLAVTDTGEAALGKWRAVIAVAAQRGGVRVDGVLERAVRAYADSPENEWLGLARPFPPEAPERVAHRPQALAALQPEPGPPSPRQFNGDTHEPRGYALSSLHGSVRRLNRI